MPDNDDAGPKRRQTPNMSLRSIRIPDELWHAAHAKAIERGETISTVIRRALTNYIKRP